LASTIGLPPLKSVSRKHVEEWAQYTYAGSHSSISVGVPVGSFVGFVVGN